MKTYFEKDGQQSFKDLPMNELDWMLFCELSYFKFTGYITQTFNRTQGRTLVDYFDDFSRQELEQEMATNTFLMNKNRVGVIQEMVQYPRYQEILLLGYAEEFDEKKEKQFAAITLFIPSINEVVIVFRGTDDTLVGWKEDFNMIQFETLPAQKTAFRYLQEAMGGHSLPCTVLGHSKGGNLALYAASQLEESEQERIKFLGIYDAPGFHREFLLEPGYQRLHERTALWVPQDSIVGQMLHHELKTHIVESRGMSMMQHDLTNWVVGNRQFERASDFTVMSKRLHYLFTRWIDEETDRPLHQVVDVIFQALMDMGITSLNDFSLNVVIIFKQFRTIRSEMEPENISLLKETADRIWTYYQEAAEQYPRTLNDTLQVMSDQVMGQFSQIGQAVKEALLPNTEVDSVE